jgi:hypothetical protein
MRWSNGPWIVLVLALRFAHADDSIGLNDYQNENGVVAWGKWVDATDEDELKTARGYSSVTFPNIDTGGDASQLVSFTVGRPPALDAAVSWTSGVDSLSLRYPDAEYSVPVKMWILCANAACKAISPKKKAKLDKDLTWGSDRFLAERVGMKLIPSGGSEEWIRDQVSLGSDATDVLLDFTDDKCNKFDEAVKTIKQPDAINIYVVNTVEQSDSDGYQCENNYDSLILGRKALRGTLIHEIGHVFGLEHVDPGFPGGLKNFMRDYSKTRRWLTEGQVFRMHFDTESGLNKSLHTLLPAGLPPHRDVRDCEDETDDRLPCPPEEMRLWSDK